ncbi:MAG: hypothetical protein Q7J08_08815 [Methanocorpusculum sp.]|uniref:hypothetical protein n=1 Tax=Methanocorpusculum sp. TaxID=2058474 RepID=UPI002727FA71|nr:hypothetical protein [Methanocorpusculum sp.]MDO9523792.1 hypothetical protein [Methanocorpusculum sp.]
MKPAVMLLILTLLLAGGICGYAMADEPIENVTAGIGPYAGIEEQLSAVADDLNLTAKAMIAGTPAASSAEILTIAVDLDAAQTALSGTPLASADVQDLIRIKNSLETAGSELLYPDADKASVLSTLQTAHTDLTAVKDHLASTLAWAKNDQESFSSDILILEQSLTDLTNISASLETATASLVGGAQDLSVTRDQLQTHIDELILIRDELIADAVPLTITDDLTVIITGLQTSVDALESGGDPAMISAEITRAATAIESLNVQIADLPAPETLIPTESPTATETVATATPVQPTETETAPTPEVIIPTGTQAPEGDNGAGMIILVIVIVCAAGIGAGIFVIKKRSSREKSTGVKNDPLNVTSSGSADQVSPMNWEKEEFVAVPAFRKEPEAVLEKPVLAPEPVRSPEPSVKPAEPQQPVSLPSDAGPAGQYKLIASAIAKNRGIMKSEALSPRDLIDKKNPDPLLLEYVTLYEKVRYSPRSTPEDTARLTELATRILKENA